MSFIALLQTAAPTGGTSILMSILPFALIILIFYFFIISPQNKKQKETEKMLAAIKKGDKVVTIGGIHGTVSSTRDTTVIVKVDDTTKLEFSRSAIASVILDKADKTDKNGKQDKKTEEAPKEEATSEENK